MAGGITSLTVEGYRALQHLSLEGLGRVNLLTGRNNTGKSSVLEALRILSSHGSPHALLAILGEREESVEDPTDGAAIPTLDSTFDFSSMFTGFPRLRDTIRPLRVEADRDHEHDFVSIGVGWFIYEHGPKGTQTRVQLETDGVPDLGDDTFPQLVVQSEGTRREIVLDSFSRGSYRLARIWKAKEDGPPCAYVSPSGGETSSFGPLWDSVALSDGERDVVDALRIIDGTIEAVSMIGGEASRRSRTAIVRSSRFTRPVPLRSFGDGLNRLFGIALALVNAEGGFLLIDEFENGMHHTVQLDTWRAIFKLASRLDVQVFATSHSWDAVEAFQQAAAETPEDGVLIRLTRRDDEIIPTIFREDELAIVTREKIEVR